MQVRELNVVRLMIIVLSAALSLGGASVAVAQPYNQVGQYTFEGPVGIGTFTPGDQLDITGLKLGVLSGVGGIKMTQNNQALRLGGGDGWGGSDGAVIYLEGGTYGDLGNLSLRAGQSGQIEFNISHDNTKMIIDNAGNVGIGTTSTLSRKLEVNGKVQVGFNNEYLDHESLVIKHDSDSGGGFFIQREDNEPFMTMTGWDSDEGANPKRAIFFGGGEWGAQDANTIYFYTDYDYSGEINEGDLRMVIKNDGNVGIGTLVTSGYRLSLDGGHFRLMSSNRMVFENTTNNNSYYIYNDGVSGEGNLKFNQEIDGDVDMVIDSNGNVGIGNIQPEKKLHVQGDAKIAGDLIVDGNIAAKYQDLAEYVKTSEQLSVGTVVMIDPNEVDQVLASDSAYNTLVAGVVSPQPGIVLGEDGDDKAVIAHTGRVKVKVDTSHGEIKTGDLLVTSYVKGYAMKSEPVDLGGVQIHRPGTIIGKALESLEEGKQGKILALITLQ